MSRILIACLLVLVFALPGQVMAQGESQLIELHTNKGLIIIKLDPEKAPVTSANFKQYVEDGFYDGLIFHRVIPNFMIQGGGFTTDFEQKETRPAIKNEADNGLQNDIYTVAMARTDDPDSATSQFFINVKDNGFLNHKSKNAQGWGYCVFGKVIDGQDVVDSIARVVTGRYGPFADVPKDVIIIEKAVVRK